MEYNKVYASVMSKKKGSFTTITYRKKLKTLKMYSGLNVEKLCTATVRFGVTYDNIGNVIEKRRVGVLPSVNAGLSWGEWDVPGYFIGYKGSKYLRCTKVPGTAVSEAYFVDGASAKKEDIIPLCQKSEFSNRDNDVFTINVDNIISV